MRRLAQLLRRIAQGIDPQARDIEFYTTQQLANEIAERNDAVLVYWGDEKLGGEGLILNGTIRYSMQYYHIYTVASRVNVTLGSFLH